MMSRNGLLGLGEERTARVTEVKTATANCSDALGPLAKKLLCDCIRDSNRHRNRTADYEALGPLAAAQRHISLASLVR